MINCSIKLQRHRCKLTVSPVSARCLHRSLRGDKVLESGSLQAGGRLGAAVSVLVSVAAVSARPVTFATPLRRLR